MRLFLLLLTAVFSFLVTGCQHRIPRSNNDQEYFQRHSFENGKHLGRSYHSQSGGGSHCAKH